MNNKPMLLTTDDLAEGVYAASGDQGNSVKVVSKGTNQGNANQHIFGVTLPNGLSNHFKIKFVFSSKVNDSWGGNGSFTQEGDNGRVGDFWYPPTTFDIIAVSDDPSLSVVSCTVENL